MDTQVWEDIAPLCEADWEQLSTDAKDFVQKLLTVDQTKRPSAADALGHPWLNQAVLERSCVILAA